MLQTRLPAGLQARLPAPLPEAGVPAGDVLQADLPAELSAGLPS